MFETTYSDYLLPVFFKLFYLIRFINFLNIYLLFAYCLLGSKVVSAEGERKPVNTVQQLVGLQLNTSAMRNRVSSKVVLHKKITGLSFAFLSWFY